MRSFNVFSEMIVPYPGETFNWVANAAEVPSGSTITVSSSDWPLTESSYTVTPGTPTQATANNEPNAEGTFECSPAAPDVTTQNIVIAAVAPVDVCDDVAVIPGDYFIWQNDTSETVIITPDPGNENYWPLPGEQHEVPPSGYLTLQIPTNAAPGQSYDLVVATAGGGAACPQAGQPKIIVGTPPE
jgi:hypothetical protein